MGRLLSIEIDKENIKIVEASRKGEILSVLNCLTFKTSLNFTEGKSDSDDISYVANKIRNELEINNIKTKKTIFVVNSNNVITRKIKLPLLKKSSETLSMIKNELGQLISVDLQQYKIIYKIININTDNDMNNAFYVVYCLPLSIYNQYIDLSQKLKLKMICLDVSFNCLNRIFEHNIKINNEAFNLVNIYAFINIGLYWCSFCVVNNGVNDFSKILILDNVKDAEIAAEEISFYGLNKPSNTSINISKWIEEISKYIRYYYSVDSTNYINKIYIYGECSEIKDISKHLSESLNIEVSEIDIISNVHFNNSLSFDHSPANYYFNSILSLFSNKNDNYFCHENHNKYGIKTYVTIIISISMIIIVVGGFVLFYSNHLLKNKINDLELYLNNKNNIELNLQIEKIKNDNWGLEKLLKEIETLNDIVNNSNYVNSYILKEIYDATPINTKVTSILVDRNSTQLTCVSESIKDVTLFLQRLRKIQNIDTIHMPNIEVNQNDYLNYSYSIICRLKDVKSDDY